jgi:CRISPR/Cas system-associated exonuclease Cas4 (RecB family)
MSQYYNSQRKSNLYDSNSKESFRISRTKIELFLDCPRCFYLDRKLGVARPPGFPFSLNNAVDALLKQEFDIHRAQGTKHPLMISNKIEAIPFQHEKLEEWRDSRLRGITYLHQPTNLLITGGVDDVWINPQGELIIVDYKATSKNGEVNIDADWQITYKRQMEIYQWLFKKNNFKVSDTGYFVYCNGRTDVNAFDQKLEFDINLIPYKGDDSWIEKTIFDIHKCLNDGKIPEKNPDCDYCNYIDTATTKLKK